MAEPTTELETVVYENPRSVVEMLKQAPEITLQGLIRLIEALNLCHALFCSDPIG